MASSEAGGEARLEGSMGRSRRGRVASSGWASSVVGESASMIEKKKSVSSGEAEHCAHTTKP